MSPSSRDASLKALRLFVWALGLGPLLWTAARFLTDNLGANPIEAVLHWSGRWGLILLLAGLVGAAHLGVGIRERGGGS